MKRFIIALVISICAFSNHIHAQTQDTKTKDVITDKPLINTPQQSDSLHPENKYGRYGNDTVKRRRPSSRKNYKINSADTVYRKR